jgi:hypothetical protein
VIVCRRCHQLPIHPFILAALRITVQQTSYGSKSSNIIASSFTGSWCWNYTPIGIILVYIGSLVYGFSVNTHPTIHPSQPIERDLDGSRLPCLSDGHIHCTYPTLQPFVVLRKGAPGFREQVRQTLYWQVWSRSKKNDQLDMSTASPLSWKEV